MQLGKSTFVMSLPTKWVKQYNVQKGDELDVVIQGPSIFVSSDNNSSSSEECFEMDISELSNEMAIRLLLPVLHKNGYNKIEFTCKSEQIPHIQARINSMLFGYEIVGVSGNKCIIKMISHEMNEDFDNLIRRVFLVTLQLAENVYLFLKEGKEDKLEELLVLEHTNNKLTNYVERLINKQVCYEKKHSYLYVVTWIQESIGDEYKHICNYIKKEQNVSPDLIETFGEIHKFLRLLYELFYTFSFEKVEEIYAKKKELSKHMTDLTKNGRSESDLRIIFLLFTILRHVEDSIGSVIAYHH